MSKGVFQLFADGDQELTQALKEFNDFRNKKKKPMTDKAKERMCRKLEKYPRDQWIDILHQSIDQGWTDIYDLKPNAPVSGSPDKYASSPSFLKAIRDLLDEAGSDGRYHGTL